MSSKTRRTVRVCLRVTGVTSNIRRAYRALREQGWSRYDANLFVAGCVAAIEHGTVSCEEMA